MPHVFFTSNYPQAHSIQSPGVLFSLLEHFSWMCNCKSWYVARVTFIPWSSFFHFLTWTHASCFFTSNYPQVHSIQLSGAFFLCWSLFSLMHNCKSWYVVHVIFIPWSSFFHFLTWTHVSFFYFKLSTGAFHWMAWCVSFFVKTFFHGCTTVSPVMFRVLILFPDLLFFTF